MLLPPTHNNLSTALMLKVVNMMLIFTHCLITSGFCPRLQLQNRIYCGVLINPDLLIADCLWDVTGKKRKYSSQIMTPYPSTTLRNSIIMAYPAWFPYQGDAFSNITVLVQAAGKQTWLSRAVECRFQVIHFSLNKIKSSTDVAEPQDVNMTTVSNVNKPDCGYTFAACNLNSISSSTSARRCLFLSRRDLHRRCRRRRHRPCC